MSYFKKALYNIGTVGKTDKVNWQFVVKDDVTVPIEYVETFCGCTQLESRDKGIVKGTLTMATAGTFTKEKDQVSKTIVVCFDDGLPEYIANDIGRRIVNPNKMRQTLTIAGNVIIEDEEE